MVARKASPATTFTLIVAIAFLTCVYPNSLAWAMVNPFLNTRQIDSSDLSPFTKWTSLMPRYERERAEVLAQNKCVGEGCLNQQWEKLLVSLRRKPINQQMAAINDFFNAMPYVTDMDNYGLTDYWQTPYELMERGGDCEDYAIAKYISLKRLGVPENAMRILVVRDEDLDGTIHALLEVKVNNVPYILDNQSKKILSTALVYHYLPVFAINESKWWAYQ